MRCSSRSNSTSSLSSTAGQVHVGTWLRGGRASQSEIKEKMAGGTVLLASLCQQTSPPGGGTGTKNAFVDLVFGGVFARAYAGLDAALDVCDPIN